jgi:hypothetical protein
LLTVISLGAGVQSTTMALMAARGEITPMPDCAIMADTQHEPKAVYEHLRWLMSPGVLPFPVHTVTRGDLWKSAATLRRTRDGERTYLATGIPVFTAEGAQWGIGKRQCTRTFKIEPVQSKVREIAGLKAVLKKHGIIAEMWIGISQDEAHRAKPSEKAWIAQRWPLLEKGMDRQDCFDWIEAHGYPEPPRSACTFCPFRDDDSWLALTPEEFAQAVEMEKQLQAAYAEASELRAVPYLTDRRIPLDQVKFTPSPRGRKPKQLSMFGNECAGACGV